MATWADLEDELEKWTSAGEIATFWWRDDDVAKVNDRLRRLCEVSSSLNIPIALAVIPTRLEPSLASLLEDYTLLTPILHGYTHENYASAGLPKAEFGPDRPIPAMINELAQGWSILRRLPRALPIFVAPWNTIDPALLRYFPETGLHGLSGWGPRGKREAKLGIAQTNVHVDVLTWSPRPVFAGVESVLEQLCRQLESRRLDIFDRAEPTGIMTHNFNLTEGCWEFLGELCDRIQKCPGAEWLSTEEAFWGRGCSAELTTPGYP